VIWPCHVRLVILLAPLVPELCRWVERVGEFRQQGAILDRLARGHALAGILFWRPRLALHMRSQGQHQPTNRRPLSPHNRQRGSRRPQHTTTASSSQEATSTEQETKCTGQHIPCPTKYLTVQLPNATTAAIASAKATGEHAHTMAAYHAGFRYVSTATESKTAPRVARQSAAGRRAWPLAGRRRET
jgi:hypothetical protein